MIFLWFKIIMLIFQEVVKNSMVKLTEEQKIAHRLAQRKYAEKMKSKKVCKADLDKKDEQIRLLTMKLEEANKTISIMKEKYETKKVEKPIIQKFIQKVEEAQAQAQPESQSEKSEYMSSEESIEVPIVTTQALEVDSDSEEEYIPKPIKLSKPTQASKKEHYQKQKVEEQEITKKVVDELGFKILPRTEKELREEEELFRMVEKAEAKKSKKSKSKK